MRKNYNIFQILLPFIALIIVYMIFKILQPERFGSWSGIFLLTQQSMMQMALACGMFFLLSLGMFDLTVGINAIISAMVAYHMSTIFGIPGLLIGGIVTGVIISFISGQIMQRVSAPSMIISVGIVILLEALSTKLTMGGTSVQVASEFRFLGAFPYNIIFGVLITALSFVLLRYTKFGLYIRAIGTDDKVTKNLGINIKKYTTYVFILCGTYAAIYGVVNMCYSSAVSTASSMTSVNAIFKPIMACMFAIAFKKHINPIFGLFIGLFFLNLITNGLLTNGLESSLQNVIVGLALIIIVRLSNKTRKYDVVK